MYPQDQKHRHPKKYPSHLRLISIFIAIIIILFGTIVAIYTNWDRIVSLILTALGVVLALLPIAFPSSSKEQKIVRTTVKEPIIIPATPREFKIFREHLKATLITSNVGALVVYANEDVVGCIVYIFIKLPDELTFYTQFRIQPLPSRIYENELQGMKPAFIARHQINNHYFYAAVFPSLLPATYHIELHSNSDFSLLKKTVSVVHSEQVAEIDWRDVKDFVER